MKKYSFLIIMTFILIFMMSCDEENVMPTYTVVGDSYVTYVEFSVSENEPAAESVVEIVLSFSNYTEDPIETVTFIEQIGSGEREVISTVDLSNEETNGLITHTLSYNVPNTPGEKINIYVELRSKKEYPQIERLSFNVQ